MNVAAAQSGATDSATAAAVDVLSRRAQTGASAGATTPDAELRELVGEFVGNVFYGTLLRQMSQSTLKGKYMHGGRGEEVFQSQLHMEYAKRLGRAPGDPIADRIYETLTRQRRAAQAAAADGSGAKQ